MKIILMTLFLLVVPLLSACNDNPKSEETDEITVLKTDSKEDSVTASAAMESEPACQSKQFLDWQVVYIDYLENFNYDTVRCAYVEDINRDGIPEIIFGVADGPFEYFISYYSAGEFKELNGIWAGTWGAGINYNESVGLLMNLHGGTHVRYTFYDYIDGNYEKKHDLVIWNEYVTTYEPDFYAENAVRVETWYWYYSIDGVDSEGFIDSVYSDLVTLEYGNDLFNESLKNILELDVNGFNIKGFEEVINFSEYNGTKFVTSSDVNGDFTAYIGERLFLTK